MEIIQVTTFKVASSAAVTHNPEGVSAPELCLYWDRVAQIPDHSGWLINELDIDAGGFLGSLCDSLISVSNMLHQ